jgi:putative transposase
LFVKVSRPFAICFWSKGAQVVERFSLATVDTALLNLEQWPTVDEDTLGSPRKQHFLKRCQAIRLLRDACPRNQVSLKTGISGKTAMRLLKRCLALHPDGRIYGYRALIPNIHIVPYARRTPDNVVWRSGTGASGAFTQLLRTHPKLEELVRQHILTSSLLKFIAGTFSSSCGYRFPK